MFSALSYVVVGSLRARDNNVVAEMAEVEPGVVPHLGYGPEKRRNY